MQLYHLSERTVNQDVGLQSRLILEKYNSNKAKTLTYKEYAGIYIILYCYLQVQIVSCSTSCRTKETSSWNI